MDAESAALASRLVDAAYVKQACEAQSRHTKLINDLLNHVWHTAASCGYYYEPAR